MNENHYFYFVFNLCVCVCVSVQNKLNIRMVVITIANRTKSIQNRNATNSLTGERRKTSFPEIDKNFVCKEKAWIVQ